MESLYERNGLVFWSEDEIRVRELLVTDFVQVVCEATNMEVCSISRRRDFPEANVLEVAIGTDRCVHNFFARAAP